MGLLSDPIRSTLENPDNKLRAALAVPESESGIHVNQKVALSNMAVYNSVRLVSESIASLPLKTYRRRETRGKDEARDHILWDLLHKKPNPEMTSMSWRETSSAHVLLWGNSFSLIRERNDGLPRALWPIHPRRVDVRRVGGRIKYDITNESDDTETPTESVLLDRDEVLHIPGLSFNGRVGLSPIANARRALGFAIATEKHGARFFKNDATPGGVLRHPQTLTEQAKNNIRRSWNKRHRGSENSHKISILEEDMEWQETGIPLQDAQFIEAQKYSDVEVARLFNVPPHKIKNLENATFSNIEEQNLEYVIDTLRPWLVRYEQGYDTQLVPPEDDRVFVEHVVDGLLRGDAETRSEYYSSGIQNGWFSVNDVREKENMNPVEGGDKHFVQLNLMELSSGNVNANKLDETDVLKRSRGQGVYVFDGKYKSSEPRSRLIENHKNGLERTLDGLIKRDISRLEERFERSEGVKPGEIPGFLQYGDANPEYTRFEKRARALAQTIGAQAASEVESEVRLEQINDFTASYVENFLIRHKNTLKREARARIEGDTAADLGAALGEFRAESTKTIARREAFRLGNAVSRAVFSWSGVESFTWQKRDDSPYCELLHGESVGTDEYFIEAGRDLGDHEVRSDVSHPPAGDWCTCLILPGESTAEAA